MESKQMFFKGELFWLSNFYPCEIELDGITYPSLEHAYQAAKTTDPAERAKIAVATIAAYAKRIGTTVTIRPDWNEIKLSMMTGLLMQKFAPKSVLANKLMALRGDIVEGVWWHDLFWGKCWCKKHNGEGRNELGKALMLIRDALNEADNVD